MTRPTWAHIDDAKRLAYNAEAHARTVAQRRDGVDHRIALQAADTFKRGIKLLSMIEREDET